MAAAAYLNMPENGGYFECKDPLEDLKGFYYHDTNDWMWKEIPVVSGDVLIFPGWLKHRTQPNNSDEERWVITTNFEQEFNKDGNYYKPKYSTNN
jgi:ectoine hydroxylase-related dioxygenase (phytanoyl-CoA dioxygenase family)